jgi:iron(III) transport system permease protein
VLPPLWYLIQSSFHTTSISGGLGEFTFGNYQHLFLSNQFWRDFTNSIEFAIGSSLLALGLGGSMAWLVERTNIPCKPVAYISAIVFLGTPYLLYIIGWLFILGKNGPINDLLRGVTGGSSAFNVYSMPGMILVEGCLWSPTAFLLLAPIFRMSNADFEDAARMAGSSLMRTLFRISMPLATPAFLGIALLAVIRSLEAFEVPVLVGQPGGINILATEVYLDLGKKAPPDLGEASAFAMVLLVLTATLIFLYSRVTRNAARFQTITGKAFRPRLIDLGGARYPAAACMVCTIVVVLALPLIGLFWLSVMPFSQSISIEGFHHLTGHNYAEVLQSPTYLNFVVTTFEMAAGAATLSMCLMTLCGWLAARRRRGAWILDQLSTIPLAFPGIVLGAALLELFLNMPFAIYGTLLSFIIAYTIRCMPYGMRYVQAGIVQIHRELEEAAGVAGASLTRVFFRIVVPLAWPTILSGWLFIFLLASGDLSISILLASPSVQPVSVGLFGIWYNGQGPQLAAFGLLWTAIMTLVSTALYFTARRSALARFGI